jgi:hypothetical protein
MANRSATTAAPTCSRSGVTTAMAAVFGDLRRQQVELKQQVAIAARQSQPVSGAESEVEAAMAILEPVARARSRRVQFSQARRGTAAGKRPALPEVRQGPTQEARREQVDLRAGKFGAAEAPIQLYAGPTGRRALNQCDRTARTVQSGGNVSLRSSSGTVREGKSLRNVNRGDRTPIELFLEGLAGWTRWEDRSWICFC